MYYKITSTLLCFTCTGLYTSPPGTEGSRLFHTYCPDGNGVSVTFGGQSRVGTGGMDSKVRRTLLRKCKKLDFNVIFLSIFQIDLSSIWI